MRPRGRDHLRRGGINGKVTQLHVPINYRAWSAPRVCHALSNMAPGGSVRNSYVSEVPDDGI